MSSPVQLLVDSAVQAAEAGDFLSAANAFAEAIKLQPDAAALHEQHSQCLMELEQHEAALTAAQAAVELMPEWPAAWTTCARCHLNVGQLQEAQQAFSKSLVLDPAQPDVQDELSEAQLLAQRQLSVQVGLLGLAIRTKPGSGVVGVTAAALGAHVTLTDLPELQPLLQANIAANKQLISTLGGSATAAVLDWTALECPQHCSSALLQQRWDFGMGADLVFNAVQVTPVVQVIASLVRPMAVHQQPSTQLTDAPADAGHATSSAAPAAAGFLMAHKQRHQQVDDYLLDALAAAGLTVSALQADPLSNGSRRASRQL
eukprot:gene11281-11431_t